MNSVIHPDFKNLCGIAGLLQKAGAVFYGFHAVQRMLTVKKDETEFFISARESSSKISKKLSHTLCDSKILNFFSLEELNLLFNRPGVSHFCIRKHSLCDLFKKKLAIYQNKVISEPSDDVLQSL